MLYGHITELIGDTPLLRLDPARHGLAGVELYAKLESANPFGSVKDRVAAAMVAGVLDEMRAGGRTVVEASSGNTAKALGVIAAMAGITVRAYTNRVRVAEMRDLLMLLEVDVHELPGLSECPDPTAPNDVFGAIAELLERSPGRYVHTSQYTSEVNIEAHYQGTGREIFDDIGQVDILVGGLGTTGSTRGAATFLREKNPELRTVGVVSTPADFIPGIRSAAEMWEVGLFQPDFYDAVVPVESAAAIDASLELALRHGILAGPTGGASYAAVKAFLAEQDVAERPLAVVFIVCDRLESYLSYYRQRRPELFGRAARTRAADLPDAEVAAAPAVGPAALAAALDTDLVVDLRGGLAYRVGHVPGSVN
ncbi:MAG: pyridoxal-phosphate dependent enzyme, partial [Mycobacteriaceae bacterium]|nr:pyridoxal-phosphate dependent enzyme [Mycobacteriaceae bacterium]